MNVTSAQRDRIVAKNILHNRLPNRTAVVPVFTSVVPHSFIRFIQNKCLQSKTCASKLVWKLPTRFAFALTLLLHSQPAQLICYNMVWEVKTQSVPQRVPEVQTQSSGMDEAFDLLKCNERLPSSPGCPSNESHMEYGN